MKARIAVIACGLAVPLILAIGTASAQQSRTGRPAGRRVVRPATPTVLDEDAESLARAVRAGGAPALKALQNALEMAGIGVLADNGDVLVEPESPSQGLAFRNSDLGRVMRSFEGGFRINLADLGHALQSTLAELADQPIDVFIREGIRGHADGNHPTLRFWSHFIVALGRQSGDSYDLLGAATPSTVNLDAIQFALILQRLAGDFYAFGASPQSTFVGGVIAQQERPCSLGKRESLVMDTAALVVTKGFDALMDYLEEKGMKLPGKIGSMTSVAGIIQSYMELLVAVLTFKAEISLEGAEPLIRTRDTRAGEQRTLVGKARMDTGNLQMINCFRPVLNSVGLDFAVENDGALSEAKVEWVLPDNGSLIGAGSGGVGALYAIVRFYGGNPASQVTDAQGVSRFGLEGAPQRKEIRATAVPVSKTVTVGMNVQLQAADIVKDTLGAVDKIGGLAGLLEMPAELLKRTRWLFNARKTIEVRDWANDRVEIEGTGQQTVSAAALTRLYNLEGTLELEAFGGDVQGQFKGRGRATFTNTWSGAMSGIYTYRATLYMEGEYDIRAAQLTFRKIEVSFDGGTGTINCTICNKQGVPDSCQLKEYSETCVVKTPGGNFENTAFFSEVSDTFEIINDPITMPLTDGGRVEVRTTNYFGFWLGSITVRLGG